MISEIDARAFADETAEAIYTVLQVGFAFGLATGFLLFVVLIPAVWPYVVRQCRWFRYRRYIKRNVMKNTPISGL
jgi:hypothetical protein